MTQNAEPFWNICAYNNKTNNCKQSYFIPVSCIFNTVMLAWGCINSYEKPEGNKSIRNKEPCCRPYMEPVTEMNLFFYIWMISPSRTLYTRSKSYMHLFCSKTLAESGRLKGEKQFSWVPVWECICSIAEIHKAVKNLFHRKWDS